MSSLGEKLVGVDPNDLPLISRCNRFIRNFGSAEGIDFMLDETKTYMKLYEGSFNLPRYPNISSFETGIHLAFHSICPDIKKNEYPLCLPYVRDGYTPKERNNIEDLFLEVFLSQETEGRYSDYMHPKSGFMFSHTLFELNTSKKVTPKESKIWLRKINYAYSRYLKEARAINPNVTKFVSQLTEIVSINHDDSVKKKSISDSIFDSSISEEQVADQIPITISDGRIIYDNSRSRPSTAEIDSDEPNSPIARHASNLISGSTGDPSSHQQRAANNISYYRDMITSQSRRSRGLNGQLRRW